MTLQQAGESSKSLKVAEKEWFWRRRTRARQRTTRPGSATWRRWWRTTGWWTTTSRTASTAPSLFSATPPRRPHPPQLRWAEVENMTRKQIWRNKMKIYGDVQDNILFSGGTLHLRGLPVQLEWSPLLSCHQPSPCHNHCDHLERLDWWRSLYFSQIYNFHIYPIHLYSHLNNWKWVKVTWKSFPITFYL